MTTRRGFMASILAASLTPRLSWAEAGGPAYLAAAREPDGGFALFGLNGLGADLFRIPLPDRGHAAAAHPTAPEAVAFARRPGSFALVIDCARGRLSHRLDAPKGRHFYGHGAFLQDGDLLCTTENDIETGAGVIGLWSRPDGYARIGEVPSGGIGPHELRALPEGELAIANGGIRTRPSRGRDKLNLETMRLNLTYLDPERGISEQVELEPDLYRNSIRHLALGPTGQVAFAMQWQGNPREVVPLLGLHRRGEPPILTEAPFAEQMLMEGYAGSVAFDGSGNRVGITSPRGGRLHVFTSDGAYDTTVQRTDICGLGPKANGFMATDGFGNTCTIEAGTLYPLTRADRAWDNHLVHIG
ncbi:hypothetical protein PARPLA_01657 [Rhodobacteraceae bacterium THAF1]|uniref:DUF1513 domain-containing protein n=1 Tax=Palleronia sp. THAF1 TaxID=2587842 RepID=UPI000F3F29AC|nr:DUF1513 domain-containing protein [Palleronia sp. THAF1]QFU08797.1 hypothetical protein FIU81_08940 [Palleronia sp. THAF1]VDC23932.1 hypothetical protein PARPLA_01657 [Rhodobacteraceae bacterium THAF1]